MCWWFECVCLSSYLARSALFSSFPSTNRTGWNVKSSRWLPAASPRSPPVSAGLRRSPPVSAGLRRSPPVSAGLPRSPPVSAGLYRFPLSLQSFSHSPFRLAFIYYLIWFCRWCLFFGATATAPVIGHSTRLRLAQSIAIKPSDFEWCWCLWWWRWWRWRRRWWWWWWWWWWCACGTSQSLGKWTLFRFGTGGYHSLFKPAEYGTELETGNWNWADDCYSGECGAAGAAPVAAPAMADLCVGSSCFLAIDPAQEWRRGVKVAQGGSRSSGGHCRPTFAYRLRTYLFSFPLIAVTSWRISFAPPSPGFFRDSSEIRRDYSFIHSFIFFSNFVELLVGLLLLLLLSFYIFFLFLFCLVWFVWPMCRLWGFSSGLSSMTRWRFHVARRHSRWILRR